MTDVEQGGSSENRRKRLLFRAQRRGFKEVDLIFGAYAEAQLAGLDEGWTGSRRCWLRPTRMSMRGCEVPPLCRRNMTTRCSPD